MLILLIITWLLILLKILGSNWSTCKRYIHSGSFLFLLFMVSGQLHAQTTPVELFQRDTTLARENGNNKKGTVLLLDEAIIQEIIATQPEDIILPIPSDELGEIQLVLQRQNLLSNNFKSNKNHLDSTGQKINLHYMGTVLDQPNAKAALSISQERVSGLIRFTSKKVFTIERLAKDRSSKKHIFTEYDELATIGALDCTDTDTMPKYQPTQLNRSTAVGEPVCVSIRVEVDQDFRGDVTALLNQVASIYQSIGVDLKIAEIYYWDRPSPYTGTTKEIIQQLQTALKSQAGLTGDLTLFIGGKGNGGRAAAVGAVCDPTIVCYSGQNNDVYTVAHELAHLFAAHHTHACRWNGNNTAIDGCGFNAGYGGCPEDDPLGGGTIMSYCHIRSVGVNLEFHPQVAEVIYNFIRDNSGCTCQESIEEEVELEEIEEISVDGRDENIVANICQMTFINPQNCNVEIYSLNNNTKENLITTVESQASTNTPVILSDNYGVYKDGILIDQFVAQCGAVFSISSCGNEGNIVTGKVLLEGFYDSSSGNMHQTLLEQNLLSKENPYVKAPWNYKGVTSVASIPNNAVDWILIMSRNAEGRIQGQSVGFIGKDGQLLDVYGNPGIPLVGANGQYISIHHRGHMAIMTSLPFQLGNAVDVTSTTASVMGNSQLKQIGKVYALHAGDYDANGVINNMDYNHWVSNSSKINLYIPSDGDGNGVINNKDYNLWISNRSKIGHLPLHY